MYVAEMSCNHNGDYKLMDVMIVEAAKAGANVIKMQIYEPDEMTVKNYSDKFLIKTGPWRGRYLWDLYRQTRTPWAWLPRVKDKCDELGVGLMVSVFSPEAVDYCEEHQIGMYKIASPEVNYRELVDACRDKLTFVSTGLASREDLDYVSKTIEKCTYMHCVSRYPAELADCNLYSLVDLRRYGPVGLSDHSGGIVAAVSATALGAVVIEKHFKLIDDCPDACFSIGPGEFNSMVVACEQVKAALGTVCYRGDGPYKRRMYKDRMVRMADCGEVDDEV